MTREFDIALIGCGLVGAPMAVALAAQGWRVLAVERGEAVQPPEDPLDQRCTALAATTVDQLRRWQLWSSIEAQAEPIERVVVTQRGYFGATRMSAREMGVDTLGHVVENRCMLHAVQSRLEESRLTLWSGASLLSLSTGPERVTMQVRHNGVEQSCHARLVIAVDGVSSAVREWLGIGTHQVDYAQSAVLGCAAISRPHQQVAYERFTPAGPLAMLPRPGLVASFVHCIEPDDSAPLQSASAGEYRQFLQNCFGTRLGQLTGIGPRSVVPLLRIEARRQIDERVLLLGNAARLLHPIAGQGYNLAIRDAAALVDLLGTGGRATEGGIRTVQGRVDDPGAAALLDSFVQLRRADQQRVVRLTDVLARGFRGHHAPLAHLRGLGLMGLDAVGPLRRRFARTSMGIG